ncbi:multidrug effflux MFS transporter [Amnibacterium sp. CER49]|uniref:multidrug effflux MFS transporter n=1 Tax=Amnibacterium sp. CER49 TaxID=3039161 RepID=UPI00244D63E4|nr:multidrug effflux MFS transporter [Amnibacterium sp. CER49]MDH2444594.1 multidrug effflux MFS transporter [Amnibacterium sp. CER49]
MTGAASPGEAMPSRRRTATIVILGLLVALGPFTIDLYLPAFPSVRRSFQVSDVAVQLTLSGTILGFAVGQLLVGPWSDRVGRRVPLLVMAALHVTSCLLAAVAPTVTVLAVLRVLQGAGAAGGGVVAQATVRDLFAGRALVKMLARMGLVSGAAPVVAPLIGSQLLRVLDWRGLFVSLAVYGAAALALAAARIGETRPASTRGSAGHDTIGRRYRAVLTDRVFVGAALLGGMQFSGLFAYLSTSSFLFQEVYGLTPQLFGLLFATNSVGIIVGSQLSARLMRRTGPQWVLVVTTAVQLLSGGTILLVGGAGAPLPAVLVPLWCFVAACGFAFPCVSVLGLAHHGEEAGTAASLLGAVNFGFAGLLSPLVGLLGIASARPMGIVMTCTAAVAVAALWVLVRPRTVPPIGA